MQKVSCLSYHLYLAHSFKQQLVLFTRRSKQQELHNKHQPSTCLVAMSPTPPLSTQRQLTNRQKQTQMHMFYHAKHSRLCAHESAILLHHRVKTTIPICFTLPLLCFHLMVEYNIADEPERTSQSETQICCAERAKSAQGSYISLTILF